MTKVAGKTAFIIGDGSGVGFGQAQMFADAGCRIAISDRAAYARAPERV